MGVKFSKRGGNWLFNWDLDIGKLGLSFCWHRGHVLGVSWSKPEPRCRQDVEWFVWYWCIWNERELGWRKIVYRYHIYHRRGW